MDVVIDANELFSCIIAKGKRLNSRTLDIFFSDKIKLFAPTKILEELERNKEEIIRKSGLTAYEFATFLELLKIRIALTPLKEFVVEVEEAKQLAPHLKDAQYFALALHINARIWSQERAFKNQKRVRVVSTNDLWKLLF